MPLKTRSHRPVPKKHGAPGKGGLCPKTTPAKAAALCGARSAPFSEQLNAYSEQLNATVRHKDPVLVAFTLPSDPTSNTQKDLVPVEQRLLRSIYQWSGLILVPCVFGDRRGKNEKKFGSHLVANVDWVAFPV